MKRRPIERGGPGLGLACAGLLLCGSALAQTPPVPPPPPAPAPSAPAEGDAPPGTSEKGGEKPVVPHADSSSAGKSRIVEDEPGTAEGPANPGDTPPQDSEPPRDPSWQIEDEADAGEPAEGEAPPEPAGGAAAAEAPAPTQQAEEEQKRFALPPPSEPLFEPPPDYDTVPYTHHQLRWDVQVGVRNSWIRTSALDPFAENDSLTQVSLSFGRGIFRSGRWSLASLAVWEGGGTSAHARSEDASYSAQRFALALEGRYHPWHWFYGYARVAPGALRTVARLEAPGQSFSYEAKTWLVSADAALGAAARLVGNPDGRAPGARLWVFLEGGYGWSATQNLSLSATSGAPERTQARELGELTLAGPYARIGLTLAF